MNKNFNQGAFNRMRSAFEPDLSENEQRILEHIEKAGKNVKTREEDFQDIYPETDIARDKKYVQDIKQKDDYRIESGRAKIVERALAEEIELFSWLGEGATVETAEYDDFKNGVDFVVELADKDGRPERLAVDATFNPESYSVAKKAKSIKDGLDRGQGSKVKYFQSDIEDFKGELTDVPKVVIAFDELNYQRYADLIHSYLNREISKKDMAEEPFQFVLLEEIIKQLENQKEYLLNSRNPRVKNSAIYKKIDSLIRKLEKANEEKIKGSLREPSTGLDRLIGIRY